MKRTLFVFIASFFFITTSQINAQTYFYRWIPTLTGTCTASGITTSTREFEFNAPLTGAEAYREDYLNGVVAFPEILWATFSGSGTQSFGGFFASSAGYPYTYEMSFTTYVDGEPVYFGSVSLFCAADGAAVVTFSNAVITPVSGGLLDDGRINPHPQAPIVAYANPVRLYAINAADNSEGTLMEVITSDEKPESGWLLLANFTNPFNGQPVELYRLSDGRYRMETSYADGKPYILEWNADGSGLVIIAW